MELDLRHSVPMLFVLLLLDIVWVSLAVWF